MKRVLLLSILILGIGCKPPNVTAVPQTYVGIWRAGSSKVDYLVFELFSDKTVKFFGSKNDLIAPVDINGDRMTVKPDGKSNPNLAGAMVELSFMRISKYKIEITDSSGVFLGVKTPVPFEKISSSEEEETNSQIISRAMSGG